MLLSSLLITSACTDDAPGADVDASAPTATLHETWDQECERFAACPEMPAAQACKARYACIEAVMSPDALAASVRCQTERACGTRDDACLSPTSLGLPESPMAAGFRADCLARRDECAVGSEPFTDDFCLAASMFQDPIVMAMAACLAHTCGQVQSCFEATLVNESPACGD
jgi:hypothetical protein